MKIKMWCLGLLVAILGSRQPIIAQEAKLLPPSPSFVKVESLGKDKAADGEKLLSYTFTGMNFPPPPKTKAGEPAPKPTLVRVEFRANVSLDRLEVATADGKAVPAKDWDKLVGKLVVLVAWDDPLDPAFAKLLAKDTVVLTTRPAAKK